MGNLHSDRLFDIKGIIVNVIGKIIVMSLC